MNKSISPISGLSNQILCILVAQGAENDSWIFLSINPDFFSGIRKGLRLDYTLSDMGYFDSQFFGYIGRF